MSFKVVCPAASLLTRRAAAFCLRCLQKRNETSSTKLILGTKIWNGGKRWLKQKLRRCFPW